MPGRANSKIRFETQELVIAELNYCGYLLRDNWGLQLWSFSFSWISEKKYYYIIINIAMSDLSSQ